MISKFWVFVFLQIIPIICIAQNETNIWYFGKRAGLDFSYSPPKPLLDGALETHEGSAVMADQNGGLLFYTNGERVWNRNHQVMENGLDLGGNASARQSSVIVPHAGKHGFYFIFTMDAIQNKIMNGLMYSVVDLNSNSGLGKVTEKGIMLHAPGAESLTAIGSCVDGEDQEFWVLAANINKPEEILAYKVDQNGVSTTPIKSLVPGAKRLNYIKFSPAGNKVVLLDNEYGDLKCTVTVADFDFTTGKLTNLLSFSVEKTEYFNQAEFSANGKYLFASSGSKILQIDLSNPDLVVSSIIETENNLKGEFQLGPDGIIYITTNRNYLSVILNPNEPEVKFIEQYIDLKGRDSSLGLPNFVRSYLYNGLWADAGEDSIICSGQALSLGTKAQAGVVYSWQPTENLDDPNVAEPVFQYTNSTNEISEFEFILTTENEVCLRKDTVKIQVYPAPPKEISGSRSVCPGVTGVEYSVPQKETYTYEWEAKGGVITKGQGSPTILVDWGSTNDEAKVTLTSTSSFGCEPFVSEFPVRINVELETETPQGPDEVCANQLQNNSYSVTRTNGSVYTWDISGGTIKAGQGTHQVQIDWDGEGHHQLWLQERSVTVDTICFGVSDTLKVLVYKDTTELALDYVSINLQDENLANVKGNERLGALTSGNFDLFRREWGAEAWEKTGETTIDNLSFSDGPLNSDEVSYEYMISSRNPCNETITSLPHRTILLKGKTDPDTDQVMLEWNPYQGWKEGVEKYEIWRRIDEDSIYRPFAVVESETEFFSANGRDGFEHHYRIKAVEAGTGHTSWSNEVSLRFQHDLKIPNVFTPNGDEFNKTFEISKLEMYPDNEVIIYNRWGNIVYQQRNYKGDWDGGMSPAGVYYYSLRLDKINRHFRGWVQIIKENKGDGREN